MATPEVGYNREAIKTELQSLGQKIARIEAGENIAGEDINKLHAQYEQLESQLNDNHEQIAA